tara:strand:+ start:66 stop:296 length:231 start_codon:yes stop_codon:yes gene_type:complete
LDEEIFKIVLYKSRCTYGGMPGPWAAFKEYKNLHEIFDFFKSEKISPMCAGHLYGEEEDSMGCRNVYMIRVIQNNG